MMQMNLCLFDSVVSKTNPCVISGRYPIHGLPTLVDGEPCPVNSLHRCGIPNAGRLPPLLLLVHLPQPCLIFAHFAYQLNYMFQVLSTHLAIICELCDIVEVKTNFVLL